MEPWQRQLIRFLFHYSASRLQIEAAFVVKHPHVPSRLYKYRQFTPSHLDALRRGVLYMSSPDKFNDPFDTTIRFDASRFIIEDLSIGEFLDRVKKAAETVRAGGLWRPIPIKKPIRQQEWIQHVMTELLADAPPAVRDDLASAMKKWLQDQNEEALRRSRDSFRSGVGVLSLSANPASILMWSHYSNSHRGFCIEYDFETLPYSDLRKRLCFPVFYRKKITDATRYIADTGGTDLNNLFGQYLCLLKSSDWAYEKEWRIVETIGPTHANRELEMPKPKAIILGSAASEKNAKEIQEFCDANDIEVKRAVLSGAAPEIIIK